MYVHLYVCTVVVFSMYVCMYVQYILLALLSSICSFIVSDNSFVVVLKALIFLQLQWRSWHCDMVMVLPA